MRGSSKPRLLGRVTIVSAILDRRSSVWPAIHVLVAPAQRGWPASTLPWRGRIGARLTSRFARCEATLPLQGRVAVRAWHRSTQRLKQLIGISVRVPATRFASELCERSALSKMEGAGKAGCWLTPMARLQKRMQAAVTTGTSRTTGLPCAMALRLIRDLPGDRLDCPRFRDNADALRGHQHRDARTTRLRRAHRIVRRHGMNHAATRCAHRIPRPTFRDDREAPLSSRRDGGV